MTHKFVLDFAIAFTALPTTNRCWGSRTSSREETTARTSGGTRNSYIFKPKTLPPRKKKKKNKPKNDCQLEKKKKRCTQT